MRSATFSWLLGVALLTPPGDTRADGHAQDAIPLGPRELVERALEQRNASATRQIMEIATRNRAGDETRRRIALAAKLIDGRLYSLGRFLEPDHLRGITILNIENADRSDDHFLYLRTLGRMRRISTAQRKDSFMGTDLTYEDFELRRVDDFELEGRPMSTVAGERVHVIEARPLFETGYERLEVFLAVSDLSMLEARHYKRGTDEPYKIMRAPRESIRVFDGRALPTYFVVENHARATTTEVWIHELTVDPDLDDSLFTATAVEVGRPIPGLE